MKKVIYIIFLTLSIISCNNNNKTLSNNEISISLGGEPRTLDPTLNSLSFGSIYMIHFFEGLTKKDKNDEVVAGMAKSWDISEDALTYTFYLRDDAKWSDGEKVKAQDFEYALKRAADLKTAAAYSHMLNVVKNGSLVISGKTNVDALGVKAIDDSTLEIVLENPTPLY